MRKSVPKKKAIKSCTKNNENFSAWIKVTGLEPTASQEQEAEYEENLTAFL